MAALTEDIAFAMREATIVTTTNGSLRAQFATARDGLKAPAGGFCDSADDTLVLLEARAALIATEGRRRFGVTLQDELIPDFVAGIPTHHVIDGEHVLDAPMLVGRLELDTEEETTALEHFG